MTTQRTPADTAFEGELMGLVSQLRAFARFLSKDPTQADDLVQEALLKAWQHRASYQPGTNLRAWTFLILRNQFLSEKRKSWRQYALSARAEGELMAVTSDTARLELDEVRRALDQLPFEQREALILVGAAGFTIEEAAAVAGCAEGTVKSRVSRARVTLNGLLAKGGIAQDGAMPAEPIDALLRQAKGFSARRAA